MVLDNSEKQTTVRVGKDAENAAGIFGEKEQ